MELRNEFTSSYFKETLLRCGIILVDYTLPSAALSSSTAEHHALEGNNNTSRNNSIVSQRTNPATATLSQYLLNSSSVSVQLTSPQCHEPIRSIRQLDNLLQQHTSRLEQFIQSMKNYFNDLINIKLGLMNFDGQNQSNNFYNQNDTLIRLLMRIESIQQPLVNLLIDKTITISSEFNNSNQSELFNIVLQILNHIRWCDVLFDSSVVITSLLESVQVLPRELQIEVISSLPGLTSNTTMDQEDIENLVDQLQTYAENIPGLIPCVLDACTNLSLNSSSPAYQRMIEFALLLLSTSNPEFLPAVTRYLVDSIGKENCEHIWSDMRKIIIDFYTSSSMTLLTAATTSQQSSNSRTLSPEIGNLIPLLQHDLTITTAELMNCQTLLIGILKTSFLNKPCLFLSFLSTIGSSLLSSLDLWMLYILADSVKYKSKILTFLIKNMENESIGLDSIKKSLTASSTILDEIFTPCLQLAQILLSSNRVGKAAHHANVLGSWLFASLYESLETIQGIPSTTILTRRQEIISSLVLHASSGNKKEVDFAMEILLSISQTEHDIMLLELQKSINLSHTSSMNSPPQHHYHLRVFLPFLKSLLDDIKLLTTYQQKILFRILFQCALVSPSLMRGHFSPTSSSGHTHDSLLENVNSALSSIPIDDITILLKKFFASLDPKIRRIALCGHVAHIIQDTTITSALVPQSLLCDQFPADKSCPPYISRLNKLLSLSSSDCSSLIFCLDELIETFEESKSSSSKFPLTQSHLTTWLRGVMEDRIYSFLGGIDDEEETLPSNENLNRMASGLYLDINGSASTAFVKIYDITYNDMTRRGMFPSSNSSFLCHDQDNAPSLSPILTLLTTCQCIVNNDLTELGLLLGAPLELPRQDVMDRAENFPHQDRQIICLSLFRAVEWIRSLLSAFSLPQSLPQSENYRLVIRLNQLITIENDLYSHCQRYPPILKLIAPDAKIGVYNPSTGKRVTIKDKGSKKEKSASDKSKKTTKEPTQDVTEVLMMEDIIRAVEKLLRPLAPHTSCLLGFGLEPSVISTLSQATSDDRLVKLDDDAVVRLLSHTALSLDSLLTKSKTNLHRSKMEETKIVLYIRQLLESGVFNSLYSILMSVLSTLSGGVSEDEEETCPYSSEIQNPIHSHLDINETVERFHHIQHILRLLLNCQELFVEFGNSQTQTDNKSIEVPLLIRVLSQVSGIPGVDSQGTQPPILSALSPSQTSRSCKYSSSLSSWSEYVELTTTSIKRTFDIFHSMALKFMSSKSQLTLKFSSNKNINESFLLHCIEIIDFLDTLLERFKSSIPDSHSPLLTSFLSRDQLPYQLSNLCDTMLQFDWKCEIDVGENTAPKGIYSSKDVGLMAKLHLKWSSDPLTRVKYFVHDIFSELKELRYNDPCPSYPTISIASCVHIMSPLLRTLTQLWKETMTPSPPPLPPPPPQTSSSSSLRSLVSRADDNNNNNQDGQDDEIDVSTLIDITHCFSKLIMLTKNSTPNDKQNSVGVGFDRRVVLYAALKEGRIFMEQFIKTTKGLHQLFASQQQLVINMLNSLQKSTRQLQSLASHGKKTRDKLLALEGPKLKRLFTFTLLKAILHSFFRVLETLIYRMKDMARENSCLGAVWVGNLKNRHIDGREINEEEDEEEDNDDDEEDRDAEEGESGEGDDQEEEEEEEDGVEGLDADTHDKGTKASSDEESQIIPQKKASKKSQKDVKVVKKEKTAKTAKTAKAVKAPKKGTVKKKKVEEEEAEEAEGEEEEREWDEVRDHVEPVNGHVTELYEDEESAEDEEEDPEEEEVSQLLFRDQIAGKKRKKSTHLVDERSENEDDENDLSEYAELGDFIVPVGEEIEIVELDDEEEEEEEEDEDEEEYRKRQRKEKDSNSKQHHDRSAGNSLKRIIVESDDEDDG